MNKKERQAVVDRYNAQVRGRRGQAPAQPISLQRETVVAVPCECAACGIPAVWRIGINNGTFESVHYLCAGHLADLGGLIVLRRETGVAQAQSK